MELPQSHTNLIIPKAHGLNFNLNLHCINLGHSQAVLSEVKPGQETTELHSVHTCLASPFLLLLPYP